MSGAARLLLAPVLFVGLPLARMALALLTGLGVLGAFGALFGIRVALDMGQGVGKPLAAAYGCAAVAAVASWLRRRF